MVTADTALTPFDAGTFGSRTTPTITPQLRRVASAARDLLIEAAAKEWNIAPAGLVATGVALTRVEPVRWTLPVHRSVDALLITSANAIRLGGDQLRALAHVPVWCVGEASAAAASDNGFSVTRTGHDGIDDLLADAPPARLLWLAGAQRTQRFPQPPLAEEPRAEQPDAGATLDAAPGEVIQPAEPVRTRLKPGARAGQSCRPPPDPRGA